MEKQLFKDVQNLKTRESYLKDNCETAETISYTKAISDEDLQKLKDQLIQRQIEISEKEEEKAMVTKQLNDELKGMKEVRDELIGKVKHKSEYKHGTCYKFIDRDERMTGYYDSEGDLVYQRPSTADEMQMNMFIEGKKTGTDD